MLMVLNYVNYFRSKQHFQIELFIRVVSVSLRDGGSSCIYALQFSSFFTYLITITKLTYTVFVRDPPTTSSKGLSLPPYMKSN